MQLSQRKLIKTLEKSQPQFLDLTFSLIQFNQLLEQLLLN